MKARVQLGRSKLRALVETCCAIGLDARGRVIVGDAVATLERAIAAQPDFVLVHAARAGVLMTFGEQRFAALARDSIVAAEALVADANWRGRCVEIVQQLKAGRLATGRGERQ